MTINSINRSGFGKCNFNQYQFDEHFLFFEIVNELVKKKITELLQLKVQIHPFPSSRSNTEECYISKLQSVRLSTQGGVQT